MWPTSYGADEGGNLHADVSSAPLSIRAFVPDSRHSQLKALAKEEAESRGLGIPVHAEQDPAVTRSSTATLATSDRRVAQEGKIVLSEDGQFSCLNTGLVTPHQEALYASFEANRRENAQPWFFKGWFRRGRWELNRFPELPDLAHYFDDPSCLVLDIRKDLRLNVEHIIEENREHIPNRSDQWTTSHYRLYSKGPSSTPASSCAEVTRPRSRSTTRVRSSSCCDSASRIPRRLYDHALVIERHQTFYRAATSSPSTWPITTLGS